MRLADILRKEFIFPAIRAGRKNEVIRELAEPLAEQLGGVDKEVIARILADREQQGSTAINEGIAVPHGKLNSVGKIAVCLGRSRKGVDFGSADGRPTHFFLAVVAPANSKGDYLKLLARFSHVFKTASFREKLMAAKTADDMHQIIQEEDSK